MILILGSANADLLFKVEKLPLPGETVLCPDYQLAPGGKGANQAAAAAKAGSETRFAGHVGDDANGPVVRGFLEEAGIDCRYLAISDNPTAVAVIGVDLKGENSIIVASGANLDTRHDQIPDNELGPSSVVLCQNEIKVTETAAILKRAKGLGAVTILNLAPAGPVDYETLDTLDYLIVNEIEARMVSGDEQKDIKGVAADLARKHDLVCVVTLGGQGAMAVRADGKGWRCQTLKINAVDTTGAGDAFTGIFASWLEQGNSLNEALHAASVGAALSCMAVGAQSAQPGRAAILDGLKDLAPPEPVF